MAFTLARSSSGRDTHHEDLLSSALHAALQTFSSSSSPPSHSPLHTTEPTDMQATPTHLAVDIVLNNEVILLKGTGVDVEPSLLSGNVVLQLTESTSIKEIVLQFRGKARIPLSSNESSVMNNTHMTYIVCQHEWSFLEGDRKHNHTLKPGRHLFPFSLYLGGSLPSSIATTVFGGATITYKLRATVLRSAFQHNLQAVTPVTILRSFTPSALEYQQTLEIENTWPEKLMYSLMIPHKAWAAGDDLIVLVKFSPLAKGTQVHSVVTQLNETSKIYTRSGFQEATRSLATTRHAIVRGKAVLMEQQQHRHRIPLLYHTMLHSHASTLASRSSQSLPPTPNVPLTPQISIHQGDATSSSFRSTPREEESPPIADIPTTSSPITETPSSSANTADGADGDLEISPDEISTTITIPIPTYAVPSHSLDPIIISHRIRWSILIVNADGHTSELRCSLPLHILDHSLLEEAKDSTRVTRQLLLNDAADGNHDAENPYREPTEGTELPSYSAHIRDRVANIYLPESQTVRVTNPWVHNSLSPIIASHHIPPTSSSSGVASPFEAHFIDGAASLPSNPRSGTNTPLEWVNSELLLSLSADQPPQHPTDPPSSASSGSGFGSSDQPSPESTSNPPSRPGSHPDSQRTSRLSSRVPSRVASRAPSPERSSASSITHVHSSSSASRTSHGLFHISMKPFTSLSAPWSNHAPTVPSPTRPLTSLSRANSSSDLQQLVTTLDPNSGAALLHRAFTAVPDYSAASRGFLGGGVTPLSSMAGLPSYQETQSMTQAQRSMSDTNVMARFAQATTSG